MADKVLNNVQFIQIAMVGDFSRIHLWHTNNCYHYSNHSSIKKPYSSVLV